METPYINIGKHRSKSELTGYIGDATRLIDIWKNRRINVSGIKYFDAAGRLLRLEVTGEPKSAPRADKRVNLDRVLDADFTNGKTPEDYVGFLRGIMAKSVYWDSCCFIGLINKEKGRCFGWKCG